MGALVIVAFGVLAGRLWQVSVCDAAIYQARLAARSELRVRKPPVRGEIRDRNGVVLAENRETFDIEFYLPEMVRAWRATRGPVPMIRYEGKVHDMAKMLQEPDIVTIVDTAVVPKLREFGLPAAYDAEALRRHYRTNAEVPFVFLAKTDYPTVSKFSEHQLGLPGVQASARPKRFYPYGALASHVLGYVGEPQEIAQLPDAGTFAFYEPNVEGKAQIEQALDKPLSGQPGARVMERNLKGAIEKEVAEHPASAGDAVALTLDARIQFVAEQALRSVGRGGAVVVDPNNGDILAMASVPSFDPNEFIPSVPAADWEQLVKDPTTPLVNRAISTFPPGSTFKAVTALAGIRAGNAARRFSCSGGVSYGNHYFKCWNSHGHGNLGLSDAIKVSCNAYFYQYGNDAGIDSIDVVGTLLGLGQVPAIGLTGEEPGILPSPTWLRLHSPAERWSSAQTANVSIGQGYDLVSPLQLVMVYSAIANGGTAYAPRLVHAITKCDGRPDDAFSPEPHVRGLLSQAGISREGLDLVRQGLWKVVNEDGGTGGHARLPGGIVAGKTGTAQAQLHGRQDTVAWFVGFAPFDHPRYAVCVMVQGGAHGGSVAAPIAARILEETLAMDAGSYHPELTPLPPARHSDPFRMIDAVNFPRAAAPGLVAAADAKPAASARSASVNHALHSQAAASRLKQTSQNPPHVAAPPPARPPNFFERLFHLRSS